LPKGRRKKINDVEPRLLEHGLGNLPRAGVLKGFMLRICIEAEKELQVLGCGWRIVTCQFRGNNVLLHHNGNVATMKRKAFSELLAAVRVARPKRRRPSLRLVVSNPTPSIANAVAA
jgi:hypothetical protein